MKCTECEKKAISSQPQLCAIHFKEYVVKTVQATIEKFSLFTKQSKICVAVSGGKDSLALLHVLKLLNYNVEGLFIDEGIENYREKSKRDLRTFIEEHNISLKTISFEEATGFSLDDAMKTKKFHACTICGTLRRYLLNKHSKHYDVIATGHNLDDEAQTILINLARANTDLFLRAGPKSKEQEQFTQKVKPFYYLTEKQILTYVILHNIQVDFGECPYAFTSYRAQIRDLLNNLESKTPGTKRNILDTYLQIKNQSEQTTKQLNIGTCSVCKEASQENICKACTLQKQVKKELHHS